MNIINVLTYQVAQPAFAEIKQWTGMVVLEFGVAGCGYCQAAHPLIVAALADYPQVRHVLVEDGKGRRLGRLFGVKLWPTLIFLKDGQEVARVVRPVDAAEMVTALVALGVGLT